MYSHYANSDCIVFNLSIEFVSNHSYNTQTEPYFCHFFVVRLVEQPTIIIIWQSDFSWSVYN